MALCTRLRRCLTLATCVLLLIGCATPEVPGVHQRDRDSWADAEDDTLGGAVAMCGGAVVLLGIIGLVGVGTLWYAHKHGASRAKPDEQ